MRRLCGVSFALGMLASTFIWLLVWLIDLLIP